MSKSDVNAFLACASFYRTSEIIFFIISSFSKSWEQSVISSTFAQQFVLQNLSVTSKENCRRVNMVYTLKKLPRLIGVWPFYS